LITADYLWGGGVIANSYGAEQNGRSWRVKGNRGMLEIFCS